MIQGLRRGASGDADDNPVLLWTRCAYAGGSKTAKRLVEMAEEPDFKKIIAKTTDNVLPESEWTCRVLVG